MGMPKEHHYEEDWDAGRKRKSIHITDPKYIHVYTESLYSLLSILIFHRKETYEIFLSHLVTYALDLTSSRANEVDNKFISFTKLSEILIMKQIISSAKSHSKLLIAIRAFPIKFPSVQQPKGIQSTILSIKQFTNYQRKLLFSHLSLTAEVKNLKIMPQSGSN